LRDNTSAERISGRKDTSKREGPRGKAPKERRSYRRVNGEGKELTEKERIRGVKGEGEMVNEDYTGENAG